MFKNLRIQKKLTVSFIIVAFVASISGIVGAAAMFYIANQYDYALKNYGFSQGDIGKVMVTFADVQSTTRGIIGFTDEDIISELMTRHDKKKETCQTYMKAIEGTLSKEAEVTEYEAALATVEEFWKKDTEILEMGSTTDEEKDAQAQKKAAEELMPLYDKAYSHLEALMNLNVTTGNKLQNSLNMMRGVLLFVIIAVIVSAMLISFLLGNSIAKSISTPLHKLSERLKTFAAGVLTEEFPESDMQDEVSDMTKVAKAMAENLTEIIQDAKYRLEEMAGGNYTVESSIAEKYVGEFSSLNAAIHRMNLNMNDTLHQIEDASEQVSAGSGNLAEASQSLAEGATEQAGAVEELLATMTNLTAGINKTSENVEETYQISRKYADTANESRKEMQGMVDSMGKINETSKKIGSIIAEIEEIASQTNLLSLNASIEAARAGEAGRGFAVVAGQIGKLADESAQSAVSTRELITSAILEIEAGTEAAGKTSETINIVVNGMNHIADSAKEIADLTKVQAEAMKQAESGVNQISEVVQANSATAEESSATSEELSAQAVSLDELVKQFKLREIRR